MRSIMGFSQRNSRSRFFALAARRFGSCEKTAPKQQPTTIHASRSPSTFCVATWNVQGQAYTEIFSGFADARCLRWNERRERIDAALAEAPRADIVCLQELQGMRDVPYDSHTDDIYRRNSTNFAYSEAVSSNENWVDMAAFLLPRITSRGYDFLYSRAHTKTLVDVGNAVAWDRTKWRCIAKHTVPLGVVPPFGNARSRRHFSHKHVAAIVVLEHYIGGQILVVCSTHLFWKPKHEEIKLQQTMAALEGVRAAISKIRRDHTRIEGNPPLILCGDFNSEYSDPTLTLLTTGEFDDRAVRNSLPITMPALRRKRANTDALGPLESPIGERLYSAYESIPNGRLPWTTRIPEYSGCVDHILFSDRLICERVQHPSPNADALCERNGIPSSLWPSDHLKLQACFRWADHETRSRRN